MWIRHVSGTEKCRYLIVDEHKIDPIAYAVRRYTRRKFQTTGMPAEDKVKDNGDTSI